MAGMLNWMSSTVQSTIATAASLTASTAAPAVPVPSPAAREHHADPSQAEPSDGFDRMDDDMQILLPSRTGRKVVVTIPLTWGLYLRSLLNEKQPIVLPFGTVEAHKALAVYYQHRELWEQQLQHLQRDPVLLLELLELSGGLQCAPIFQDGCKVFGDIFQRLSLPWPIENKEAVMECGNTIRVAFQLGGADEMTDRKVQELVRYFSFLTHQSQPVDLLTHSVDHSAHMRQELNKTNDVDFHQALEKIDPFRQRVWQADNEADVCPSCKKPFVSSYSNYIGGVYASHCRVCGLRKCVDCTAFKVDKSIARLSKPGAREEPQMRKACVDCYRVAKKMLRNGFLGQVFVESGLSILQISMLRTVNADWSLPAELILHGVRAALYEFNTSESIELQYNLHDSLAGSHKGAGSVPPSQVASPCDRGHPPATTSASSSSRDTVSSAGGVTSAPRRSIACARRLYTNSAKLFKGHPEHVILLFLYLDWSDDSATETAIEVLQATVGHLASSATSLQNSMFSHWHLLCTRSCSSMRPGIFGVRMLDALRRAPPSHPRLDEAAHIVLQLLKGRVHDGATKAAMVPLLLDLESHSNTHLYAQDALGHLARGNPTIAMQAICDFRSRASPDSSFYDVKFFAESMQTAAYQTSVAGTSPRPLDGHSGGSGSGGATPRDAQANKFLVARRFLEQLEECLQQVRKDGLASDEAAVKRAILDSLRRNNLIMNIPDGQHLQQQQSGGVTAAPEAVVVEDEVAITPMMYPFNRRITIVGILISQIRVMASKVRPVMIPLKDILGDVHHVLWKAEPLRQDYVVCLCGGLIQQVLFEKGEIRDALPSYSVLPLSQDSGLVECVNNARSIQDIVAEGQRRGDSNPLLSYLLSLRSKHPNEVAKALLPSAKFFILFNYLLKLRDRHRDNVMVRQDGSIFHIDFGMILNEKTVAESVTTSHVRFDGDLERSIVHLMSPGQTGGSSPPLAPARTSAAAAALQPPPMSMPPAASSQRASSLPQSQPAEAGNKKILEFLKEVSSWFCTIRPYAHEMYLLLHHLAIHKRAVAAGARSGTVNNTSLSASQNSTAVFVAVSLGGNFSWSRTEEEDDVELRSILDDIFLRSLAEVNAKEEFIRRVLNSRGKERVKDWTYETKKVTSNWLYDLGSRVVNLLPPR